MQSVWVLRSVWPIGMRGSDSFRFALWPNKRIQAFFTRIHFEPGRGLFALAGCCLAGSVRKEVRLPSPMETSKFDQLAHDACSYVFDFMVGEKVVFVSDSHLIGPGASGTNLLGKMNGLDSGFYSISVGYIGDAEGMIILILTRQLAERFTCKLLDMPSIEWTATDDLRATIKDTMGELGNSFVGLVKGALTKVYPHLTLTTPEVNRGSLIAVNAAEYSFRKQYHFTAMGSSILVDICHK